MMRAEFSNGRVSCLPLRHRHPQGGEETVDREGTNPSNEEQPRGLVTNLGLVRTNLGESGDKAGLGTAENRR